MDITENRKSTLSGHKKFLVPNIVIITEKPSVAQEYRKVLKISPDSKTDGYIEGKSAKDQKNYIITWAVGHLVTMSYPEVYDAGLKKWNLDSLPFLPEQYRYEVISSVKKQFSIVKKIYNRKDITAIYYAGDSGREGIYIQMLIRQMAGHKPGIEERVVWIDSQTETAILNGIRDAKPVSEYARLTDAAYMRAIEDYAIGINFSRALTCKYGKDFNSKIRSEKWKTISVGRVMTCVLGMIVDKEREIRDFVETPFYRVEADTGFLSGWKMTAQSDFYQSPLLYNETGFRHKRDAELLLHSLNMKKALEVVKVLKKEEKKSPPLLYNLADLQNDCSRIFKISPDQTLAVVQKLYESKLTTYPRTDARVLTTAVCNEIHHTLNGLVKMGYKKDFIMQIAGNGWHKNLAKTHYCNDAKVTDHYAIIPTGQGDISNLTELERNIYHLITDRFISIFYPPAIYIKTGIELRHESGEAFFANEKVLKEQGYLSVCGDTQEQKSSKVSVLSSIKEGDVYDALFAIKEGKTTPPKRYTSGTMITAMENSGQLIEDEELREQIKGSGIGTSATRAEIIKKLVKIGYISLNSKTQVLTPHKDGELIYDIVKSNLPALLSPKMTASWEKGLSQIENGLVSRAQYQKILDDYIRREIQAIKTK